MIFERGEQQFAQPKDGVVADVGGAAGGQHIRPMELNIGMQRPVLIQSVELEANHLSHAAHVVALRLFHFIKCLRVAA
jgi:hypothetical protein